MKEKLLEIEVDVEKIETISEAKAIIKTLLNTIEALVKKNQQLTTDMNELKEELRRHKKQSNPPAFTKQPKSNPQYSSREQKEKGVWKKTIKRPRITIDREEQLPETETCTDCGSTQFTIIRTWNKIVQGLLIKKDTIQYHGRDKKCRKCGKLFSSHIPDAIKGKGFSSTLRTWVSIFKYDCRISEQTIHRFLTGLEIVISHGQITEIILENSKKLGTSYGHLRTWGQKLSRYLHSDATIFFRRTGGKIIREHLHFVGHELLSIFTVTHKYNSLLLKTKVLTKKAIQKIIYISDDASANGKKLLIRLKQLCWIHEIRHYLKLTPSIQTHRKTTEKIIGQLWEWYKQAKDYGRDPTAEKKQELTEGFNTIMEQTTGYQELDNRLLLTRNKRERLLLFLDYPGIPIENNQAERDLRPAIILRKLSGGTRSLEGDRSFERHMSVIHTTRKQGLHVFNTLHGLLNGELSPFLLTQKTLRTPAV